MHEDNISRFEARRAFIPVQFEARSRKSARLWRRIFRYYRKHAGRVWHSHGLRPKVSQSIAEARAAIEQCQARLRGELGADYDSALERYETWPVYERFDDHARFAEVLAYVELFRMADRVFIVVSEVRSKGLITPMAAANVFSNVSTALRAAAQVVSETPGEAPRLSPQAAAAP